MIRINAKNNTASRLQKQVNLRLCNLVANAGGSTNSATPPWAHQTACGAVTCGEEMPGMASGARFHTIGSALGQSSGGRAEGPGVEMHGIFTASFFCLAALQLCQHCWQ